MVPGAFEGSVEVEVPINIALIKYWGKRDEVSSVTNFPVGAGLASSAAGFAAIAFAIGVLFKLPMEEVSILARRGSGSACRSVFGGLVEWQAGNDPSGLDSVAVQRLPGTSWPELRCVIVVLDESEKEVGSSEGMRRTAASCEVLQYRASTVVPARIQRLLKAYETHNFDEFARIVMADSNQLHAVCMDSFPPLKVRLKFPFFFFSFSIFVQKLILHLNDSVVLNFSSSYSINHDLCMISGV
ncbi:unnamed protein product [Nippostrongylus brasiliensis]|uniref:Diphosphomevalonate decarboxylase n=1 Tax=Nippostrongylus brasiliensis TaxID=27835 RepID=A0A0N4Y7I0_NIPBR|nr:unnamed protein product [Nippostrongylus brasiliensis]